MHQDQHQTYDLDTLGNRLVVANDGAGQSYGPQAGGQLTNPMNRYETVDADTLSYDARGNTLDDGINTYAYDILNRQTVVTNTAAITTEYIYDARGRRVAKVTARGVLGSAGITITHYLYDIQYRVLEERDGAGQLLALYTYGAGIDEPLTMERDGQTYYYHRDALGSVTELSDSNGAIVERYEYDVYGAVTIYDANWITRTASAAGNPYLFTGRRFDPESGNYYYRARVYSPALGRFLSMDPLAFQPGSYDLIPGVALSHDLNRYIYARNNSLRYTDPSGQFVVALIIIGGGLALIADYGWQVYQNTQEGTDFWHAVYHENIDEGEMGGAFVAGAAGTGLSAVALPAVPALVEALGLTGAGATTTVIGLTTMAGAGASTAGEFTGRVWQNSWCTYADCPTRDDLWDVSTYQDDLLAGGVTGFLGSFFDEVYIKPTIKRVMTQAEATAIEQFKQQGANRLWDYHLTTGESFPSTSTEGFSAWADWQIGPPTEWVCPTPHTAVFLQSLSEVSDVALNDDLLEKLALVIRDIIDADR